MDHLMLGFGLAIIMYSPTCSREKPMKFNFGALLNQDPVPANRNLADET
jgi:hypothetical protein